MTRPDRPQVLYIAGSGRSGSTIVARWLEQQLNAIHVGEMRYLWDRGVDDNQLCECGHQFNVCPFWHQVLVNASPNGITGTRSQVARLAPKVDRFRRIPADIAVAKRWRRLPGASNHAETVRDYAETLAPVYEQVRVVSKSSLIIDSSKDPSYLYALKSTGRLDLSVIHLVRDSRAVAHSWTRQRLRPEIHYQQQMMNTRRPTPAARSWMEVNLAVDAFARLWPTSARLRYEDFAAEPSLALTAAEAAMGAAPAPRQGDWLPSERHSFSGNPIRFDTGPIQVRIDSSWTSKMAPRDRRTVSVITAPLLRKYGYPLW